MANMQSNEQLEDRLRRMILTGDLPNQSQQGQALPPIVRLPPSEHQLQYQQSRTPQQSLLSDHSQVSRNARDRQPQQQRQNPNQSDQHRLQRTGQGQQQQQQQQQHFHPQNQPDPGAFNRPQYASFQGVRNQQYRPNHQPSYGRQQQAKARYLEEIFNRDVRQIEMGQAERQQKEAFRLKLQQICQDVCSSSSGRLPSIQLHCFGSFSSGFASAGSDMDLVIVANHTEAASQHMHFSLMEDDLPRELELRLLQLGVGARLLTRTRVPIIKICELPTEELLSQLREERQKWDSLSFDDKYPHLKQDGDNTETAGPNPQQLPETAEHAAPEAQPIEQESKPEHQDTTAPETTAVPGIQPAEGPELVKVKKSTKWTRERKTGPLDFPKDGIGIQSDINFFNPLGLHNTQMLRCYSLCDIRVRPMVLFVKAWAKTRKINSAYSGTLSSYGYVLMVLHYLVNVVRPPVLPNLQAPWRPHQGCTPPGADVAKVDEWMVDFWRRESEIIAAARQGQLSQNQQSLGDLLAGFFQYYASAYGGRSFHWMQSVLSLRTPGGILTKEDKGWVKARTEEGEGHKVQYRYLFCIEDPFELSHNVARTVTHFGIVAIRDEFRRAHRILMAVGNQQVSSDGDLFDQPKEEEMEVEDSVHKHKHRSATNPVAPRAPLLQPDINTTNSNAFPALRAAQSANKANTPQSGPGRRIPLTAPEEGNAETAIIANAEPNSESSLVQKDHRRRRRQPKIKLAI